MRKRCAAISLACGIVFLLAMPAPGQIAGTGSIQGTVSDSSGAVVPQAAVTAVNLATGVQTGRVTTAAGLYVITPLPAGTRDVSACFGRRISAAAVGLIIHDGGMYQRLV